MMLKKRLYDRIGEGYEEAVAKSMTALGAEKFILNRKKVLAFEGEEYELKKPEPK